MLEIWFKSVWFNLGLRVQGLGFMVKSLRFRSLGLKVQCLGWRVQRLGFRVKSLGFIEIHFFVAFDYITGYKSYRNAILYRSHIVVFTDDYIIWRPASENPSDEATFQAWPCLATKDIFSDEASRLTRSLNPLLLDNTVKGKPLFCFKNICFA